MTRVPVATSPKSASDAQTTRPSFTVARSRRPGLMASKARPSQRATDAPTETMPSTTLPSKTGFAQTPKTCKPSENSPIGMKRKSDEAINSGRVGMSNRSRVEKATASITSAATAPASVRRSATANRRSVVVVATCWDRLSTSIYVPRSCILECAPESIRSDAGLPIEPSVRTLVRTRLLFRNYDDGVCYVRAAEAARGSQLPVCLQSPDGPALARAIDREPVRPDGRGGLVMLRRAPGQGRERPQADGPDARRRRRAARPAAPARSTA